MIIRLIQKLTLTFFAALFLLGCNKKRSDSSASVQEAKKAGVFVAEYAVPANADLGDCRLLEVWVEKVRPSDEQKILLFVCKCATMAAR